MNIIEQFLLLNRKMKLKKTYLLQIIKHKIRNQKIIKIKIFWFYPKDNSNDGISFEKKIYVTETEFTSARKMFKTERKTIIRVFWLNVGNVLIHLFQDKVHFPRRWFIPKGKTVSIPRILKKIRERILKVSLHIDTTVQFKVIIPCFSP